MALPLVCHSKTIKLIKCIEDKNSIITINNISVSVIPEGLSLKDLKGFKRKKCTPIFCSLKTFDNFNIATFEIHFSCQYGGNYDNRGYYLANASASIKNIIIYQGFNLTFNTLSSEALNYGSFTDPIAGLILSVEAVVDSCYHLVSTPSYNKSNLPAYFFSILFRGDGFFSNPINNFIFTKENGCINS